ncbi:hypothetical protein HZ326_21844 [Fusarium oxysporum f. sp. albedinis]|nr:hypothetical protein HZ326_21844 [Fusarium oxysporum f. sp. albedinis]
MGSTFLYHHNILVSRKGGGIVRLATAVVYMLELFSCSIPPKGTSLLVVSPTVVSAEAVPSLGVVVLAESLLS